jgi:hypothetical protein
MKASQFYTVMVSCVAALALANPGGVPVTHSRFTVDHVRVTSDKSFDDVAAAFVRQLGTYDAGVLKDLAAGGDEAPPGLT